MTRFSLAAVLSLGTIALCSASSLVQAQEIDWSRSWVYASGTATPTSGAIPAVTLVGHANGVADTTHHLVIHLRSFEDSPLSGVTVSFGNRVYITPGLGRRVCESQIGETFEGCDANGVGTVSAVTDANGEAILTVEGASDGYEHGQWDNANINRTAGVISLVKDPYVNWSTSVEVAVLDLDGAGGVGASDLSVMLQDVFDFTDPAFGGTRYRGDYNFDGTVNSSDLSFLLGVLFHAGSYSGCGSSLCP